MPINGHLFFDLATDTTIHQQLKSFYNIDIQSTPLNTNTIGAERYNIVITDGMNAPHKMESLTLSLWKDFTAGSFDKNQFEMIYQFYNQHKNGKFAVNCAGGIGRSGVIAMMIELLEHDENYFNSKTGEPNIKAIDKQLIEFRKQRPYLVQKAEQFPMMIALASLMRRRSQQESPLEEITITTTISEMREAVANEFNHVTFIDQLSSLFSDYQDLYVKTFLECTTTHQTNIFHIKQESCDDSVIETYLNKSLPLHNQNKKLIFEAPQKSLEEMIANIANAAFKLYSLDTTRYRKELLKCLLEFIQFTLQNNRSTKLTERMTELIENNSRAFPDKMIQKILLNSKYEWLRCELETPHELKSNTNRRD